MIEANEKKNATFEKAGYKKTKLGLIPKDWSTPTIDEVFEFLKTTSFSRNQLNYDDENDTYYIHYGDIHSTYKTPILDFEEVENVPKLNNDVVLPNSIQYLKDGDVIIADASEDYEGVGTAIELQNLDEKKVISGLHTFALRDKEGLTVEGFRTYIFKNSNVKKALKTIATGSKVYGISKGNIQKFKILLPTLPEQQKIASVLNIWDKAIAAQEKLIAKKQQLKKGLMQQLLSGKKRFPGFIEEWREVLVGEIASIKTGDSDTQDKITDGRYPFFVRSNTIERINSYSFDGEAILTSGDGVGVGKIYHYLNEKFDYHQRVYNIHNFKPYVDGKFFFYFFSQNFYRRVVAMSAKNSVDSVRMDMIAKMPFSLPSIKEQEKIATSLSLLDDEIKRMKRTELNLKNQKQGLMQQLLTGEKRAKI